MNITLQAELMGLTEPDRQIDIKPKTIQTNFKNMFIISVLTNFPADFAGKTFIRKVLALKIKDTSCYFHFPL